MTTHDLAPSKRHPVFIDHTANFDHIVVYGLGAWRSQHEGVEHVYIRVMWIVHMFGFWRSLGRLRASVKDAQGSYDFHNPAHAHEWCAGMHAHVREG